MKTISTPPIALQSTQFKTSSGSSIAEQNQPQHDKTLSQLKSAGIETEKATLSIAQSTDINVHVKELSSSLLAADVEGDELLARRAGSEQMVIVEHGVTAMPEFKELAEKLTGEELEQLVNTLNKLEINPAFAGPGIPGSAESRPAQFVKDLAQLDDDTLKRVLAQASELADQVASGPETDLYDASGFLSAIKGTSSANDLHNFVAAIHKTDDVAQMMDALESFDESLQPELLSLMAADPELANRVVEQLEGRDVAVAGQVLDYLAPLVEEQRFLPETFSNSDVNAVNARVQPDKTLLGMDNGTKGRAELIDGAMQLLESYSMDDAQLKDSFAQLGSLGETDQRAWMQITLTGLDMLVGKGTADAPVDLTGQQNVLDTLDKLRTSDSVRDAVTLSSVADDIEYGSDYYKHKDSDTSLKDRQAMAELLVADAWLNQGNVGSTNELASKLGQLGAGQRDQLLEQLSQLNKVETPLANMSMDELQDQLAPLQNRINSLVEADNIDALLIAEAGTPEEQKEDFWAVTELAEDQVDQLVTELLHSDSDIRAQIIDSLAEQVREIDNGEQSREEAQQKLNDMLDYFAKDDVSIDDKRRYLEGMKPA